MKVLYIIAFSLFFTTLKSQEIVVKNTYHINFEIIVIKEGQVIHHHVMGYKDQLTIKDVGWYGTKFLVRQVSAGCISSDEYSGDRVGRLNKDGWWEWFITKKQLQEISPNGGVLLLIPILCSEIKQA